MEYKATGNGPLTDGDAQVLGEVVGVLAETGPVSPTDLVEAARPEHSRIHDYFEWHNDTAAQRWRENQAAYYLRAIVVIPAPEREPVRAFLCVTQDMADGRTERGYVPMSVVQEEPNLLRQVIEREHKLLMGISMRLQQYRELETAALAVQQALTELVAVPA